MSDVDNNVVVSLIDTMRRDAEGASASVQTTLGTSAGGKAIAAIVAGFYNFLAALGGEIMRLHTALALASGRAPQDAKIAAAFHKSTQLLTYWTALAQGFATYVRPATDAERAGTANNVGNPIAVAVVVVAVAGAVAVIAVSLTGAAWAVVHYEQAQNLAAEVELLKADPATAAALAQINAGGGAGPGASGPSVGMVAAGVLGVGALAAGVLFLVKSKG